MGTGSGVEIESGVPLWRRGKPGLMLLAILACIFLIRISQGSYCVDRLGFFHPSVVLIFDESSFVGCLEGFFGLGLRCCGRRDRGARKA